MAASSLSNVAAGNDEVCALLGKCYIDAVTDGASGTVLKRGLAAAGDDYGLTSEKSHTKSFQIATGPPGRLRASNFTRQKLKCNFSGFK